MRVSFPLGMTLTLTAACSAWAQAPSVTPDPPLWVIRNADAVVYLFGGMGVQKDRNWFTTTLEEYVDESDVLWLENPRNDPEQGNELIQQYGFTPNSTVLDRLAGVDAKRLTDALSRAGIPPEQLDGRAAWLANLFVSQVLDGLNGVDGPSSPHAVLRARAEAAGKTVRSEWRNVQEVVAFSVRLPESAQLELLSKALDDAESYGRRQEAWLRGDVDTLEKMNIGAARRYPNAYRLIVVERNAKWFALVRRMLAEGGVHFVCIGVGDLVGQDNLLNQLSDAGIEAQRL